MSYIDSHVHLDRYTDGEVAALLGRAAAAGVRALLTVGVDAASSERAIMLARRYGADYGVRAAIGLHPAFLSVTGWEAELARIERMIPSAGVVALGEIGLHTLETPASLTIQEAALRAQLALARRLMLPIVLHAQGDSAHARLRAIVAEEGVGAGAVAHYFVGDLAAARDWLALGCHLSVGRPATRAGETALRKALASPDLPLERLLIETDTYPLPGRTTEPADVVGVAEAIAALKGISVGEVAEMTSANVHRLFPVGRDGE